MSIEWLYWRSKNLREYFKADTFRRFLEMGQMMWRERNQRKDWIHDLIEETLLALWKILNIQLEKAYPLNDQFIDLKLKKILYLKYKLRPLWIMEIEEMMNTRGIGSKKKKMQDPEIITEKIISEEQRSKQVMQGIRQIRYNKSPNWNLLLVNRTSFPRKINN